MFNLYLSHSEPGEKIIIFLRRHWLVILLKILFFALAGVLPVFLYFSIRDILSFITKFEVGQAIFVLFASLYYLYLWLFLGAAFVDYYLDVWIVTDRRILNIEQKGLFNRVVAEQRLYRVQDVTSELKGILPTFFNYGIVQIQTAAESQRFIFKDVPDPRGVAKKIMLLAEQSKKFQWLMDEEKKNGLS